MDDDDDDSLQHYYSTNNNNNNKIIFYFLINIPTDFHLPMVAPPLLTILHYRRLFLVDLCVLVEWRLSNAIA